MDALEKPLPDFGGESCLRITSSAVSTPASSSLAAGTDTSPQQWLRTQSFAVIT